MGASRKRVPTVDDVLDLVPVRLASWREVGERIVVERPRPGGKGLRAWLTRLSHSTGARRLRLDPIGTSAWRHFDGKASVRQVAGALREQFGEGVEPAEQRLSLFVRVLLREGMLGA